MGRFVLSGNRDRASVRQLTSRLNRNGNAENALKAEAEENVTELSFPVSLEQLVQGGNENVVPFSAYFSSAKRPANLLMTPAVRKVFFYSLRTVDSIVSNATNPC